MKSPWNPISTVPENELIDLWVVNTKDKYDETRFPDMFLEDGKFYGSRNFKAHDKATHWMYAPYPPHQRN